jgi:hypothetical protein
MLDNNKKASAGRQFRMRPTDRFVGTSIVPKLNTKLRSIHLSKEPAELRVEFVEFTRSKREDNEKQRDHFERDLSSHLKKVFKAEAKYNDKEPGSVFTLPKVFRSSRKESIKPY